ncbi:MULTISPECIES: phage major capsid protein [unclassified Priestia]|uniref:phage major capsid protein n=1 Tax=unclassified Priestia TaxID=2800374 RepID=UPI003671D424
MKTLKEIEVRSAEIQALLEGETDVDVDALETEMRELAQDKAKHEKRARLLKEAGELNVKEEVRTIESFNTQEHQETREQADVEKRAKDLKEDRAITVASGDLVLPKHTSSSINGTFNQISTLLDRVKLTPMTGGESFQQPYEVSHGEGGYTDEQGNYVEVEVETDYATIGKTKITAYSEVTEEVQKLPAANYEGLVINGVGKALRQTITKEILVGNGAVGHLTGIFSNQAKAIDPATDLAISAITAETLDEIIFSYGNKEDVEAVATLILSKADLKAFAMLRDGQDKKVYEVKSQGNTGTIDGVPYIINSVCAPVSVASTPAGAYAMAYGVLQNYELVTFSGTDIQRSNDFKFKQGMIAHRGSVFVGGNVVAHNGFLRVKKAPTA